MEVARGACQGHRSELFAARVPKAFAAHDVRFVSQHSPLIFRKGANFPASSSPLTRVMPKPLP